jgi:predicted nucleotidyltransferase
MYQKGNKELDVIALYTSNYKAEFYLRQIAKLANLSLKTCQNVLASLEKEKVLKGKVEGKNKYFSLNLENIQTKSYLLQAEIHKLNRFLNNYPQFNIFLKSVHTTLPIIIFGSFAKMKSDKNSDVDLLVLSQKEQKLPFHLLAHKVHQINLPEESFKKALNEKEALIKEVEESHIILNNPSSYVNLVWEHYGK